jgi:hypothetical protein
MSDDDVREQVGDAEELKDQPAADANDRVARQPKQSDVLIELAASAILFHTPAPDNDAFADIVVNGHRETYCIRGKAFKNRLRFLYFKKKGTGCNTEAMQVAIETIAAKALYEGEERQVHVRIAEHKGNIYIDIGDDNWRVIEVTSNRWHIIHSPPVRFVRSASTRALPFPQQGGTIELLRQFCNLKTESEFVLLVGHLYGVMRPNANYPVLVETGEQGSCKSTLFKLIGRLTDPRIPELRSLPANEDDLIIAAKRAHLLVFDNISGIRDWLSDAFCRLSTGGGAGKRKLYSDDEEILFDGRRAIFLNGIEDVVTRGDLVDRCNILNLEVIPESKRSTEAEITAEFERQASKILGALLNGLVAGLRNLPTIQMAEKPRMADFVIWAEACCRAHWEPDKFLAAHREGMAASVELVIEASPVGVAVRKLMEIHEQWSGTAQGLLDGLSAAVGEQVAKERDWPRRPNKLSGKLKRVAPALRKIGIHVTLGDRQGHGRTRLITIQKGRHPEHQPHLSSASSAYATHASKSNGLAADDQTNTADDKTGNADDTRTVEESFIDRSKRLKNNAYDHADDADDQIDRRSGRVGTQVEAAPEITLRALVCRQCRAGLSTVPPSDPPTIRVKSQNGEDLWVHPECLRFWLRENPESTPFISAAENARVLSQCGPEPHEGREVGHDPVANGSASPAGRQLEQGR